MAAPQPRSKAALLSFDGGGIRGYSSLLILEKIMEAIRRKEGLGVTPAPCDYFNFIGGTSTGGIIAVLLGPLRMTAEQALDAYNVVAKEAFTPKLHWPWSTKTGKYSATKLESATQNILRKNSNIHRNPEALFRNDECVKTTILAVTKDDTSRGPTLFRTYADDAQYELTQIWEVVRATSAAITFFKPIALGRDNIVFMDAGGFGSNNPCDVLIGECAQALPMQDLSCIVSIGTGLGRAAGITGRTSLLIAMVKMATQSREVHIRLRNQYAAITPQVYWRFDEDVAVSEIELDDYKKMPKISTFTSLYLNDDDTKRLIEACADAVILARNTRINPGPLGDHDSDDGTSNPMHEPENGGGLPKDIDRVKILPPRDDLYVPRIAITQFWDRIFTKKGPAIIRTALHGLGGAGKTQAALDYAHKFAEHGSVIWIDGNDEVATNLDMKLIASTVSDVEYAWKRPPDVIREWLEKCPHEWLLVVDDVESPEYLRGFLPASGHGRILFTFRDRSLLKSDLVRNQGFPVNSMTEDEATVTFLSRLLLSFEISIDTLQQYLEASRRQGGSLSSEPEHIKFTSYLEDKFMIKRLEDVLPLLENLDRLPIGLVSAAAYMSLSGSEMTLANFQAKLKSTRAARNAFYNHEFVESTYKKNLMSVWQISHKTLQQDMSATSLQIFLAFFSHRLLHENLLDHSLDPILFWNGNLVITCPSETQKNLKFLSSEDVDLEEMLRLLSSLMFIERSPPTGGIQVHRIVQDWSHLRLEPQVSAAWLESAVAFLTHQLPPIVYSLKNEQHSVPEKANAVLVHAGRILELTRIYKSHLVRRMDVALFFLELYEWLREKDLLLMAIELLRMDASWRGHWLGYLISAAMLHLVFVEYQSVREGNIDEKLFREHLKLLCDDKMQGIPITETKAWLMWAIVSKDMASDMDLDEATITTTAERNLNALAKKARSAYFRHATAQITQSIPDNSCAKVSIVLVSLNLCQTSPFAWQAHYDLLIQKTDFAAFGVQCGLEEMQEFYNQLLKSSWQILSRTKDGYLPTMIKTLRLCAHAKAGPETARRVRELVESVERNYALSPSMKRDFDKVGSHVAEGVACTESFNC